MADQFAQPVTVIKTQHPAVPLGQPASTETAQAVRRVHSVTIGYAWKNPAP